MRLGRALGVVLLVGAAIVPTAAQADHGPPGTRNAGWGASISGGEPARATGEPLAGRTIVIDPGHQLGNHNFPAQVNRQVPAGGFTKPCNTTGTATQGATRRPPSPGRSPGWSSPGCASSAPPS